MWGRRRGYVPYLTLSNRTAQWRRFEHPCGGCGKLATKVCTQCGADESGWLCDRRMHKHERGEDDVLPVVNSPRVGVCGDEG